MCVMARRESPEFCESGDGAAIGHAMVPAALPCTRAGVVVTDVMTDPLADYVSLLRFVDACLLVAPILSPQGEVLGCCHVSQKRADRSLRKCG